MKTLRSASNLPNFFLLVAFLAIAPAALATNTWYVDGVNGSDNSDCRSTQMSCKTIGHAISLASSRDSIIVAPATYTENLTFAIDLKIIGSDSTTTIIDGGGVNRVVTINYPANVVLSKLTIRNGYAQDDAGGGITNYGTLTINNCAITANSAYDGGGGIYTNGTATINKSTISGNSVTSYGGEGGGVLNMSTVTVINSAITANAADYGAGVAGGGGTLTINNSTIGANSGGVYGGGLAVGHGATAMTNNNTISGNSATYGGGICNWGTLTINNDTISGNTGTSGGGINQSTGSGAVTFQNSIVTNNSGGNCVGTIISNGYNLSSDNSCNFTGPGDMNNINPKMGKLGSHGGPTQTIPLLLGSPAIDAGNPNGCTDGNSNLLTTDQRGAPRPGHNDTGRCDIGAFERQN